MKTRMVTVREGECLGPVDWSYDFGDRDGDARVERLRTLAAGLERGEQWEATTDGGWPRVGWGRVLEVGMYDGGPYWRPVPSVLIAGRWGASWSSWLMVSDIRRVGAEDTPHG